MADDCPNSNEDLTGSNPLQLIPSSPILSNCTTGGVIFDVNKMVSAAQSYLAINSIANQMFGYDVKWFRAVPQQRSKDVIFQEYTLSNVEECPLDVKVVLPQGNMPDSKYDFDLMGLEYEVPLEVQIDKKFWESIAGFGTAPQKNDIVYFIMANKLYEVESSYLLRGFMEQETTWRLNLKKYQPKSSRREGASLKDTIDIYAVSSEEIFGTATQNDVAKLVDDKQFSPFNNTSQDKYKSIDLSLNTINSALDVYGTIVAQSFYDLQSPAYYNAVTYNTIDSITTTSDRSVTAWIQPLETIPLAEYNVSSIVAIDSLPDPNTFLIYDSSLYTSANYIVTLSSPILLSDIHLDDNVVIYRAGALNLYAKVVAITTNPIQLYCVINAFVEENLVSIRSDWNLQNGYKLKIKEPINIIDGINDFGDHVFSINIYANQYIAISYGHAYSYNDAYVVCLDDKLLNNNWYGIIVNIGNSWQQYNVNVWGISETDKNAKIENIFSQTLRLYPEAVAVNQYSINKSPAYLTNLRLYNTTIEDEKQANELLSYFTGDADQAIILDNADTILSLPYISQQR